MSKRIRSAAAGGLAVAVVWLIAAGGVCGAEPAARLVSADATLFERAKPDEPWRSVRQGGTVPTGELLVGLPGAVIENGKGTVRLTLLTDMDKNSPYPILEAAVVLNDSADHDLDFTLDRGRVDVINLKKEGSARVRVSFHDQKWEATLTEPGTRIALELYGRWPKGARFKTDPGPNDVPAAALLFLVRKGRVELKHGDCRNVLTAPPGPALMHWRNNDETERAPVKLDKLPDWAATEESTSERAERLKKVLEELRQQIAKSSPREATRLFVQSEDPNQRATGVITMGALDDLDGVGAVITGTKYPDTWDRAVVVVRHWLGRRPGQDQILYKRLIEKRGLTPKQAAGVMQLLHSFDDTDLAQPELYTMLVKFLDNDQLGIRGLAHWHLVRLVPAGAKFAYNPLDPKEQRDKAREQWKKLIDDMLAKGELPPKSASK